MSDVTSVMTGNKRKTGNPRRIIHTQVWVDERGHTVDEHILPACRLLWEAGIDTFYSCQGGPVYRTADGRTHSNKAYVQILEADWERACELLKDRRPLVEIDPRRTHKDRVAVRFFPSKEALNIPIVLVSDLPTRAERTPAG